MLRPDWTACSQEFEATTVDPGEQDDLDEDEHVDRGGQRIEGGQHDQRRTLRAFPAIMTDGVAVAHLLKNPTLDADGTSGTLAHELRANPQSGLLY